MVALIDSPTERSTAATDAVLGVMALACLWRLRRLRQRHPWKVDLWTGAFGLLSLAATLGAVAHGLKMSPRTNARIWRPLNLALGLTVALFTVGAISDAWGEAAGRQALPPLLAVGGVFFAVTQLVPGSFLVFIVYEATAMLFALALYGRLALGGRLDGAHLMTAGILITIIAAAVQASDLAATLVWEFDHNGLFHLIQMLGLPLLLAGLRSALQALPDPPLAAPSL